MPQNVFTIDKLPQKSAIGSPDAAIGVNGAEVLGVRVEEAPIPNEAEVFATPSIYRASCRNLRFRLECYFPRRTSCCENNRCICLGMLLNRDNQSCQGYPIADQESDNSGTHQ